VAVPSKESGFESRRAGRFAAFFAALLVAGWAASAGAYPSYDDGAGNGCVSCHNEFKNTGPLHLAHLTKFNISSCTLCHQHTAGEVPVLTYWSSDGFGCSGCHGLDYGETSLHSGLPKSTAYGLRRKHALEGVTVCATCHFPGSAVTGDPDPAPEVLPETVPPPYYGRPTDNLTDPCSSDQESFDNTVGLDNDGNGFPDLQDSACAALVSTTTTTGVTTTSTTTTTFPGTARRIVVYPGQSIQDAVNAIAPGGTVYVMPGVYQETHGGTAAVTVSKDGVRLIGASKRKKDGPKVVLQAYPGQRDGIVVQPAVANTRIDGFLLRGFTIQGFPNNGVVTRYLDNFRIERNESIGNLENGIWPTLSANGLVKKNVAYGSEDSALWVEASENVRVVGNELYDSPTGLEITVSNNIIATKNNVHDNTTGVGLYHPSAAGLPPLQPLERNGFWTITNNWIHDNNAPNSAPPGSMSANLPPGGGILLLGVHDITVQGNRVENNDFYGTSLIDYCVAVAGTSSDCTLHPPQVTATEPDSNTYVSNTFVNNGTNPVPFGGFEHFAADIAYLLFEDGHTNCFAKNTYTTLKSTVFKPTLAKSCK
jgi:parallel beta-helix repeat protein